MFSSAQALISRIDSSVPWHAAYFSISLNDELVQAGGTFHIEKDIPVISTFPQAITHCFYVVFYNL